jgi:glutathione S-transferase
MCARERDAVGSAAIPVEAKLYVLLGSHACRTGMLLLEHKGIEYERVELTTGLHPFLLRLRGFGGDRAVFRRLGDGHSNLMLGTADRMGTVPSLLLDGEKVKTNREIARFLDRVKPDPPLFPADPERRQTVEEAEKWGDEVFQMAARRIVLASSLHGPDALANRGNDGRLGPLLFRQERMRIYAARFLTHLVFRASADAEPELLASLPGMLDRIDGWIEAGVLNGEELNAADFMIAPSLALIWYRRDLQPEIEQRRALALIDRLLPDPSASPVSAAAA